MYPSNGPGHAGLSALWMRYEEVQELCRPTLAKGAHRTKAGGTVGERLVNGWEWHRQLNSFVLKKPAGKKGSEKG